MPADGGGFGCSCFGGFLRRYPSLAVLFFRGCCGFVYGFAQPKPSRAECCLPAGVPAQGCAYGCVYVSLAYGRPVKIRKMGFPYHASVSSLRSVMEKFRLGVALNFH